MADTEATVSDPVSVCDTGFVSDGPLIPDLSQTLDVDFEEADPGAVVDFEEPVRMCKGHPHSPSNQPHEVRETQCLDWIFSDTY